MALIFTSAKLPVTAQASAAAASLQTWSNVSGAKTDDNSFATVQTTTISIGVVPLCLTYNLLDQPLNNQTYFTHFRLLVKGSASTQAGMRVHLAQAQRQNFRSNAYSVFVDKDGSFSLSAAQTEFVVCAALSGMLFMSDISAVRVYLDHYVSSKVSNSTLSINYVKLQLGYDPSVAVTSQTRSPTSAITVTAATTASPSANQRWMGLPGGLTTSDGIYSWQLLNYLPLQDQLQITDFGFSVPSAKSVGPIGVSFEVKTSSSTFPSPTGPIEVSASTFQLLHSGSPIGDNWVASGQTNNAAGAFVSGPTWHMGDVTDPASAAPLGLIACYLEGSDVTYSANPRFCSEIPLTPGIVNNSTFGLLYQMGGFPTGNPHSTNFNVDNIRLTVFYTEDPTIPPSSDGNEYGYEITVVRLIKNAVILSSEYDHEIRNVTLSKNINVQSNEYDHEIVLIALPKIFAVQSSEYDHEIRSVALSNNIVAQSSEYDHEIRSVALSNNIVAQSSEYDHEIASIGKRVDVISSEYNHEITSVDIIQQHFIGANNSSSEYDFEATGIIGEILPSELQSCEYDTEIQSVSLRNFPRGNAFFIKRVRQL